MMFSNNYEALKTHYEDIKTLPEDLKLPQKT